MKLYRLPLYLFMCVLALSSCYEEPEFPLEPEILDIESIVYRAIPDSADKLIIRVLFQDGDGDLGLYDNELDPDTTRRLFILPPGPGGQKYKVFDPAVDRYNCKSFQYFDTIGTEVINDTVAVEYNKFYYNFNIELLVKRQGQFEVFDFRSPPYCTAPLSGRFTPLKKDGFSDNKPLKGVLQYTYNSNGDVFRALFRNDTLKIRVQIIDRALNESNVRESDAFTITDIITEVQPSS